MILKPFNQIHRVLLHQKKKFSKPKKNVRIKNFICSVWAAVFEKNCRLHVHCSYFVLSSNYRPSASHCQTVVFALTFSTHFVFDRLTIQTGNFHFAVSNLSRVSTKVQIGAGIYLIFILFFFWNVYYYFFYQLTKLVFFVVLSMSSKLQCLCVYLCCTIKTNVCVRRIFSFPLFSSSLLLSLGILESLECSWMLSCEFCFPFIYLIPFLFLYIEV